MVFPVPFGEETAWCAFQTTEVDRVCEVLFKDRKPRPVSWEEGVDAASHWPDIGFAKVLVTPRLPITHVLWQRAQPSYLGSRRETGGNGLDPDGHVIAFARSSS
jgi:hypothetical protein